MNISSQFVEQVQALLPQQWQALIDAITTTEPVVSVRMNPSCDQQDFDRQQQPAPDRVPWCPQGYYLPKREPFTFNPAFRAGRFYVQDASSMFLHHVIKQLVASPVRYLDLCAAPGGKTTTALSALPEGSLVVANEFVTARARVLCENVVKWGNPNVVVTNNAPRHLGQLTQFFDVIAADVPCSGEGMFRKDETARSQWSPALVKQCADLQRSIINDAWAALRPGGLLIYSTCTYNRSENEEMLHYLVSQYGAEVVEVPNVDPSWNIHPAIDSPYPAYRFMPHLTRGEGLFMAVLRKAEGQVQLPAKLLRAAKNVQCKLPVSAWLKRAEDFVMTIAEDEVRALPKAFAQEIALLQKKLNVFQAGITMGVVKGKNCVPSQALALSSALNKAAFPVVKIDYDVAIAYFRGEAIVLPPDAPRGYVLLTTEGVATPEEVVVGFANNLGNRANNLYPKSWRILSTHVPPRNT